MEASRPRLSVNGAGERGAALCYNIPNVRIDLPEVCRMRSIASEASLHPFQWSLGEGRAQHERLCNRNQIDVMAAAAKQDPLAFRMRL